MRRHSIVEVRKNLSAQWIQGDPIEITYHGYVIGVINGVGTGGGDPGADRVGGATDSSTDDKIRPVMAFSKEQQTRKKKCRSR